MKPAIDEIEKSSETDGRSDDSDITITGLRLEWFEEITHRDGTRETRSRSMHAAHTRVRVVSIALMLAFLFVLLFRPELFEPMSALLTKILTRAG